MIKHTVKGISRNVCLLYAFLKICRYCFMHLKKICSKQFGQCMIRILKASWMDPERFWQVHVRRFWKRFWMLLLMKTYTWNIPKECLPSETPCQLIMSLSQYFLSSNYEQNSSWAFSNNVFETYLWSLSHYYSCAWAVISWAWALASLTLSQKDVTLNTCIEFAASPSPPTTRVGGCGVVVSRGGSWIPCYIKWVLPQLTHPCFRIPMQRPGY